MLDSTRNRIWIGLHAVIVLIPVIGMFASAWDVPLYGVEAKPELPKPSIASWRAEKLQPGIEKWFESRLGFRGVLIRTDNSIQTSLVGETKPSSPVIKGEHDTLFLKDDISYMNKPEADLPSVLATIDVLTKTLGSVQQKLTARGKTLVVVIAPSKTAIYPDDIPARWHRQDGVRSDVAIHDELLSRLTQNGVTFTDGHLLAGREGAERELVFMKTARHWTTVGACEVLRKALLHGPVTPTCAYDIAPPLWSDWRGNVDFDLDRLLNVWRSRSDDIVVPVLRNPVDPLPPERRPRAVIVGTSFIWMLTEAIRPFVSSPIALYYNTTAYDASEGLREIGPIDESMPQWADYVLDRDLYVLEVLETYAHGEHMVKFVQTLDRRLDSGY